GAHGQRSREERAAMGHIDGMKARASRAGEYPACRTRPGERRRSTMQYIAFDAHKHYTLASVEQADGRLVRELQIPHERGALRQFLQRCDVGSPVAVETTGNWYWIVDEIERLGVPPGS